jgi:uncharacterized protein involved in exopolysaccharide biosynthesis
MAANPYELTTREVLSILFKEWRKLAGVFLGLALLVIGWSYTLTPYYEASTRLLIKSGREFQVRSDPTQPVASVPSATKQEIVNSEIQILTSRDLVEAVINKVGVDRLYPETVGWFSWLRSGGAAADPAVMEAAVRKFFADFKAAPVELADVIEVTYRNPDHDIAVQTLNTMVELYQQKHALMFSDPRYKFLEQQTKQYENQLDAITGKVTEIKNGKSLFDVDAQRAKLLDDRASTNTILQQLRSQSVDAHQRVDFLQARLKSTPALVPAGTSQADVVEQAKARLLDLQVKAQQLRERYVGNVKPLQDTEQEMASVRQFIGGAGGKAWTQRNTAYDDMVVALNRALADAAPLDQQIALRTTQAAAIDERLRSLEAGAKELEDSQRERRTLEELVHTYRARYEEARMTEDLDKGNVVSVSVVQKPSAPARPAGPRHLPYGLAGLLIGIVGASGMLIYLLVFRETLITVESVERIIGVPVLASVPNARPPGNDNRAAAA